MQAYCGNKKRVVLLVDNNRRDLPGAALIAHHVRALGAECFLEPLEAYRGSLAAHKPHMIIFNHLTASHLVNYSNRLAELGVLVGVLPNEGIIYDVDALKFNAGKYHKGAHIDFFFCWNQPHGDALIENGFDESVRIEVIGPPRFDLYSERWSGAPRPSRSGSPSKPQLLVCTNFVFAKLKDMPREIADKFFAPWCERVPLFKDYWNVIEANHNSRKRFFGFLEAIVSSQKYEVILRPHPSEQVDVYLRWYEALEPTQKNQVVLDRESGITELILSSDLEISCETCTTALESWIARKPTIELVLEKHPLFFHPDIASLNVLCHDPADIVSLIDSQLASPGQVELREARKLHLARWCNSPDGLASHRMAKVIASALADRREPDWRRLTILEQRTGMKLRLLRALGLPYSYDPLLFAKRRIFKSKYGHKFQTSLKTIRPRDVLSARAALEERAAGHAL